MPKFINHWYNLFFWEFGKLFLLRFSLLILLFVSLLILFLLKFSNEVSLSIFSYLTSVFLFEFFMFVFKTKGSNNLKFFLVFKEFEYEFFPVDELLFIDSSFKVVK